MTYRILIDLNEAIYGGYNGIAQDNRLMFDLLTHHFGTNAQGLLNTQGITRYNKIKTIRHETSAIIKHNYFLHQMISDQNQVIQTLKQRKINLFKIKMIKYYLIALLKTNFKVFLINKTFNDVIWRNVLKKSLPKKNNTEQQFCLSTLSHQELAINNLLLKRSVYLDTSSYDFIIFPNLRTVKVAGNTTKIVRYHDSIPITDPDVLASLSVSKYHIRGIKSCSQDTIFVCNSHTTRNKLINLFPDLSHRVFTIHCALSPHYQRNINTEALMTIIKNRISQTIATVNDLTTLTNSFDYIISVATLEPRKNYINLIRAWEKFNFTRKQKLKLIVVANRGWKYTEIEQAMLPHIQQGNLIHLEKVPQEELPYLYSHAKAFVFPSYNEGFGYPPLEAMQCQCPVIISDIPVHREIMGTGAYYCDPYNTNDIAIAISQVVDNDQTRQRLIAEGKQQTRQYLPDQILPAWLSLFDQLKKLLKKQHC